MTTENIPGNNSLEKKPIYKKISFYIGIVLVLSIVFTGYNWYRGTLGYVSSDDAFVDADRLELSSKILGRVVHLYFDEGDTVKAGQLVAELDSTDLIARLNQAKTALNVAHTSIELANVNVEKSQIDFNRAEGQFKDSVIPKADYDNVQKRMEASTAELKIAKSRILTSESEINVIETSLENTKLYSTVDGVIAKKWIVAGSVVQPGMPIFSIYEVNNLWITAMLEETKINSLTLGDNVEIDVDSYPDHRFSGKIIQIGTNTAAQFALIPPSNASGNFTKVTQRIPVKISIKNDSDKSLKYGLLPGMSVEVKIKIAKND